MKNLKEKKGISLIVLVITIIVMIILAAAIILSLSNSGIMSKANKAKTDSDAANLKEYVNVLEAEWELMTETERGGRTSTQYVNEKLSEKGYKQRLNEDGILLTESAVSAIEAGIQIGDRVAYTVESREEVSKSTDSGFYADLTVSNGTNLVWRYIGISDDGKLLIAPDMVSNLSETYLRGKIGYLKGGAELNRLCDVLYSTDNGTARSMNIDDVTKLVGYTGARGGYYDGDTSSGGSSVEIDVSFVPTSNAISISELVSKLSVSFENATIGPDGSDCLNYKSNYFEIDKTAYTNNSEYVFYNNVTYILASTYNVLNAHSERYPYSGSISFGIFCVNGTGLTGLSLYSTIGSEVAFLEACSLRPVVSLTSNITKSSDSNGVIWNFN